MLALLTSLFYLQYLKYLVFKGQIFFVFDALLCIIGIYINTLQIILTYVTYTYLNNTFVFFAISSQLVLFIIFFFSELKE